MPIGIPWGSLQEVQVDRDFCYNEVTLCPSELSVALGYRSMADAGLSISASQFDVVSSPLDHAHDLAGTLELRARTRILASVHGRFGCSGALWKERPAEVESPFIDNVVLVRHSPASRLD